MGDYHSETRPANRGVTLNSLKEQLYSLNMRLLLALRNHDEETQADISRQIAQVQAEIERVGLGRKYRP